MHKANVLHLTDGLFLESARRVTAEWPSLEFDDKMVDAACYLLIKSPQQFEVMLMPNQYGDILSDMTADLGSLPTDKTKYTGATRSRRLGNSSHASEGGWAVRTR